MDSGVPSALLQLPAPEPSPLSRKKRDVNADGVCDETKIVLMYSSFWCEATTAAPVRMALAKAAENFIVVKVSRQRLSMKR
jgi:hypothetical protein